MITKKLPPASGSALLSVYKFGLIKAYYNRRWSTYTRTDDVQVYGPEGVNLRSFNYLKKKNYICLLKKDELKEMWDISELGIEALAYTYEEIKRINAVFRKKRLELNARSLEFSEDDLLTRKSPEVVCQENLTQLVTKTRINPETVGNKIDNDELEKKLDSIIKNITSEYDTLSFGIYSNVLLSLTAESMRFLKGSIKARINIPYSHISVQKK